MWSRMLNEAGWYSNFFAADVSNTLKWMKFFATHFEYLGFDPLRRIFPKNETHLSQVFDTKYFLSEFFKLGQKERYDG